MPQDKITVVRLKQQDGQYGPQIPVGTKAENVQYDKFHSVKDALGNVKAPLQEQIDNIDANAISNAVTDWLEDNPSAGLPTDKTLTISDVAADAKAAGDLIKINSQTDGSTTKVHFNTTNQTVNVALMEDITDAVETEIANLKTQFITDNGNYLQNKGRLVNGTNLNTIFDNAIYLLGAQSNAQYVNNPLSGTGFLTAKKTNAICLQTIEGLNGTILRRYTEDSGSTWTTWA